MQSDSKEGNFADMGASSLDIVVRKSENLSGFALHNSLGVVGDGIEFMPRGNR